MQLSLLLHAVYVFFGSFFAFTCVTLSALWLFYRAYCVLWTPLDELVGHLGYDIPQGPRLDLASIKADAVTLHWKPSDDRKTTNRFEVHVNGTSAGHISPSDSSFVISNLAPDHVYIFRIVVFNALDFKTSSEPVRIRTKTPASGDYYQNVPATGSTEHKETSLLQSGPVIRTFKALPEISNCPPSAPAMTRETSNGPMSSKRTTQIRRPSPVTHIPEGSTGDMDESQPHSGLEETQQQLTERLEEIGRETAETERQILEEEHEAASARIELLKEREDLRASLKEKDNISKDLRKQVSALERENATAQSRRTQQERLLHQKKAELQKVKDDTERWEKDAEEARAFVEECAVEKQRILQTYELEKRALLEKLDEETKALKLVDDDVKEKKRSGQAFGA